MNDNEIISYALEIWANYIETHSVSRSADDIRSRTYGPKEHEEPNHLTTRQKELTKRIRELSEIYKDPCYKCDQPSSMPCMKCEYYKPKEEENGSK